MDLNDGFKCQLQLQFNFIFKFKFKLCNTYLVHTYLLQESVYARDSAEVALGAVLSNFKSQIDEIVNISKPDKNVRK